MNIGTERMRSTKNETAEADTGWIISPTEQQTQVVAATADERLPSSNGTDEPIGTKPPMYNNYATHTADPLQSTTNSDPGGWFVSRRELIGETRLHVLSRVDLIYKSTIDRDAEAEFIAELLLIRRPQGHSMFSFCGGWFWFQKPTVDVITAETSLDFCNCLRQTALHIAVQHNNSRGN